MWFKTGPVIGLVGQFAVTVALAATVGLGERGWVAGISFGVTAYVLLAWGLASHSADGLGPADRVTLTRATLAGGVTALVADSFDRPTPVTTLVALTVLALVLDAVDGWVARRTRTASALGARFDMEVDAFLILVLSVYVARSTGVWVLAIGAARYAFLAAGWLLPWLRRTLPPRYWRKVVAATQGVALTFAVPDVLPRFPTNAVLVVSLALLAESFGRDVGWLCRRRRVERGRVLVSAGRPERSGERGHAVELAAYQREHHITQHPSRVPASHAEEAPLQQCGETNQPGGGRSSCGSASTRAVPPPARHAMGARHGRGTASLAETFLDCTGKAGSDSCAADRDGRTGDAGIVGLHAPSPAPD